MELFVDESGNTGCVISNNGKFNFDSQRHFVLCAVKTENESDKEMLLKKYESFKNIFNIKGEIKGSDLMTRKYNYELNYLIENLLDDTHFEICIYDKKFYVSTLLVLFLLGNEFQTAFPVQFYFLASELSFHGKSLLLEYCELAKKPSYKLFEKFLKDIISHKYKEIPPDNNPLIMIAERILKDKEYDCWMKDILSYGSYENPNYVNVINLNCLSELIIGLKWQNNLSNSAIQIHHDQIDGYDKTFVSELKDFNVNLDFVNSANEELIQLADNVVSIFAKCVNEVILRFDRKCEWAPESQWIMEQYSKILNKVTIYNIKFTIPIQNWAVSLCVKEMFDTKYPLDNRNNLFFNQIYLKFINKICYDISYKNFDFKEMMDLLKQ